MIPADPIALQPPDAAQRLLLLTARPFLTPIHVDALREIVRGEVVWTQVVNGAIRNLILHLVRRNLKAHAGDLLPPGLDQWLNYQSRQAVLRQLEIVKIQQHIASDLLLPRRIAHAFVKGATLSAEYYGDPYLRQYRDIDILLDPDAIYSVGSELLREGYQVSNTAWRGMKVQDLSALAKYSAALELRSPTGIYVELHQRLDNSGCVFTMDVLSQARTDCQSRGFQGSVLRFVYHYVYLVFHHSRHRWSSLHWTADLAAMRRRAQDHANEIIQLAEQCGLLATLQNAELLERNLDALASTGVLPADQKQSAFLADCLEALANSVGPHDDAAMGIVEADRREPDFPYAWQKTNGYKIRFQLHRVHPTLDDFNALPISRPWRWLLYATKPLRVALGGMRRGAT